MPKLFRLDKKGVGEFLKSDEVRKLVNDKAQEVAANVRGSVPAGTAVEVEEYTTDREAASVTIAHAHGMGLQAKDGVLTKAAGEAGLEFTAKEN